VVGWYVLAAAIVGGFTTGVVALALHASATSMGLACAAALGGVAFAVLLDRRTSRSPNQWQPGWRTWALVGASGPLLAGVSDHVWFVLMAFGWTMVSTILVFEERRRWKQRKPSAVS
jgi:hypothetical protein